jgi:hypothetical protein
MSQVIQYEYAGFKYNIVDKGGDDITIHAELYQHPNAKLDKHIRAALEQYKDDRKNKPKP